jgi:hypothetical protein
MPTASEESVLRAAQSVCDADGRGAKVAQISIDYATYSLRLALPRPAGMSEAEWWEAFNSIRAKLEDLPNISRVSFDSTP